jgi:hypothetical protein
MRRDFRHGNTEGTLYVFERFRIEMAFCMVWSAGTIRVIFISSASKSTIEMIVAIKVIPAVMMGK